MKTAITQYLGVKPTEIHLYTSFSTEQKKVYWTNIPNGNTVRRLKTYVKAHSRTRN